VLSGVTLAAAPAAEVKTDPALETRVQTLIPDLEAYIQSGMKAFDVPGLGIVTGDRLVYARGFGGVRSKTGGVPVDPRTVFQIGSTTKAFSHHDHGHHSRSRLSSSGTTGSSISIRISSSRTRGSHAPKSTFMKS